MADRNPAPDTPELRERWGAFEFTESYRTKADKAILAKAKLIQDMIDKCDGVDGMADHVTRLKADLKALPKVETERSNRDRMVMSQGVCNLEKKLK